ncbi:10688_t:CDS:2 [Funneliformis mosseae]|uniref:10688_t:CDS:1 n=1 Tax=Funneliformis mosseae TaxID=27381 RepID=A0A9N8WHK9_FUNMO|nr:10688_t:CDS:2 [Funneliformis mosseae]
MTSRIFYEDYPSNPYIYAQYTSSSRVFHSKYKVIAFGYYPPTVKFTQKSKHDIQYQIPDEYIIITEVANQMIRCETKYTLANKILYTIIWKEGRAEWMVSSERSASGAVNAFLKKTNREKSKCSEIHIFGFDIEILHQVRIEQSRKSSVDNVVIDKRKRPLNEVQSVSQQNKRYASFGKETHQKIKQLVLKHQMVSDFGNPICIYNMELGYENQVINIKYNSIIDNQPILDDYEFQENSDGILVDEQEIGNGIYRSIRSLLKIFIPIWSKSVLQLGDTINLKLGGDGRNVGCKQNHVMITVYLLNEKDEAKKNDTLVKVGRLFKYQLQDLQENGIYDDNGIHWPIEFFFSGD